MNIDVFEKWMFAFYLWAIRFLMLAVVFMVAWIFVGCLRIREEIKHFKGNK